MSDDFAAVFREYVENSAPGPSVMVRKTTLSAAADELERLRISHDRYEIVRQMNPRQFAAAFEINLNLGKPFDQIIDELKPFMQMGADKK